MKQIKIALKERSNDFEFVISDADDAQSDDAKVTMFFSQQDDLTQAKIELRQFMEARIAKDFQDATELLRKLSNTEI